MTPGSPQRNLRRRPLSEAERFAAAEVAAALTLTRCAAEGLVGRALSLDDLPGTAGALASG
jgi:hypothetical protein